MIAYKHKLIMKKIFTFFLATLFSSFLFGQGCPTSVDTNSGGRLLFHFGTQAAKDAAWGALPAAPALAVCITNGSIGGTSIADVDFAKGAGGVVKNNTAEFFRTSNAIGAGNSTFTGTITLKYDGGTISCDYADGALPVDLVSFNASLDDKQVALRWETASEENNEGFEIQKSSNGRDWEVLEWVEGNGTTAELNTYDYLDRAPFAGDNYYRLKQIDYDGQFEFSDIVLLRYDVADVVVEVSPNPSPGDVNVNVLNPGKERMNIELYDSAGLLIWESGALTDLDSWNKKFSLTQKEMYFITVRIGKEVFTKRILIIDRK